MSKITRTKNQAAVLKATKSTDDVSSVSNVSLKLINKYQCLPTTVVRDYAQRLTHKKYTQEVVSDALRKLYSKGVISRLTRGVYCTKGLV